MMREEMVEEIERKFVGSIREDKRVRLAIIDEAIDHTDCAWCKSQLSDLRKVLKEADG